jgi:uncharacterized Zn finger protein (UPF0148 family)
MAERSKAPPDCFFCGHPLKVASATALICTACGMAEFVSSTDEIQQQAQQQQQEKQQEKKRQ